MANALSFSISQASFEGPLELLLDLIEARKFLINDVSLSAVADEYIAYVQRFEEHPIGETAEFVAVASTLLLIKSKTLLPVLELTTEEESNIEELEHRLKLFQIFRDIAKDLESRYGKTLLHERPFVMPTDPLFLTDGYTALDPLSEAIQSVLNSLVRKPLTPETRVRKVISLEEMMKRLEDRILKTFKMRFSDFTRDTAERNDIIVGFLAVLELVKRGSVNVRQESRFSEIHIERDEVDTPKYL